MASTLEHAKKHESTKDDNKSQHQKPLHQNSKFRSSQYRSAGETKDGIKILEIGDNIQVWIEEVTIRIQTEFGILADEISDPEYSADEEIPDRPDLSDAVVDPENLTDLEKIEVAAEMQEWTKGKTRITEINRKNENERFKIKAIFQKYMGRELLCKCVRKDKSYMRTMSIYEFTQFIMENALQHGSTLNVKTQSKKFQEEGRNLWQRSHTTLFEHRDLIESYADRVNQFCNEHKKDPQLSIKPLGNALIASLFMDMLNKDTYKPLQQELESATALGICTYPENIEDAYNKVTQWAASRNINIRSRKKQPRFDVLQDSTEVTMVTNVNSNDKNKQGGAKKLRENTGPPKVKFDSEPQKCVLCPKQFHSFKDCPKYQLLQKLENEGVESVQQFEQHVSAKRKEDISLSKSAKKAAELNMYAAANMSSDDDDNSDDDYNVCNMTTTCSLCDDNTSPIPIKSKIQTNADIFTKPLQPEIFQRIRDHTTDKHDDKLSLFEQEKKRLKSMLKNEPIACLDTLANITIVNNPDLIIEDSIQKGMSTRINSFMNSTSISTTAISIWGDRNRVIYSNEASATILSEDQILRQFPHQVLTHDNNDGTPKLIGYDVYFLPKVKIRFRRYAGCMIANMSTLIEAWKARTQVDIANHESNAVT